MYVLCKYRRTVAGHKYSAVHIGGFECCRGDKGLRVSWLEGSWMMWSFLWALELGFYSMAKVRFWTLAPGFGGVGFEYRAWDLSLGFAV